MGWWRCFTGAPDNEEDSSGSRRRNYYYAGDEFGGRGAGNNRGSSDGESTSGESRTSSEMCGAEGADVGTQFRRRERLHRKMQSELCEISPEMRATIGERRISILRRQFSWHDSDNNGYIESHELEDFLRAAGFNPVQPSLELWCSHLDADNEGSYFDIQCIHTSSTLDVERRLGSVLTSSIVVSLHPHVPVCVCLMFACIVIPTGCLTFPDYVQFWQENKKELENDEFMIKMAFAFFDKDGDGTIDKDEFVECLQELGDPLTKDEIDRFFKHVRSYARKSIPSTVSPWQNASDTPMCEVSPTSCAGRDGFGITSSRSNTYRRTD